MVEGGEDQGLRVKMVLGDYLQRPSGNSEGRVLDPLEFEDSRGGCVGEPDGGTGQHRRTGGELSLCR